MASIGLRVDHGTAGTDIASVLAKALTGNVGDQVAIANLKSKLQTDEMQRQLIRENTTLATQQAIRQWQENQQKQTIFNAQTDAGDVLGKILLDQQGRPIAPATEAPVVVEPTVLQSGGGGRVPEITRGAYYPPAPAAPPPPAPEVTTQPSYGQEPDWQYRVNQFPLQSDQMPVPVEPQDFTGAMPNAPVASMPGLGGQPMLPEAPAPVEPAVVGSGSIVGMGTPLVGAGGPTEPAPLPGFLQHLLRPIGELRPGQPQITTPETSAMLAGMEHPAEQPPAPAGTLGGLQLPTEAPVPVELGQPAITAPVINPLEPGTPSEPPIAATAPETITLSGRPPVSGETTAAVPPPAAEAPAAAVPPSAPPTPAQPAIEEPLPPNTLTTKAPGSVGTGVVNKDGSSTYHTEQGPVQLTPEETNKLGLAIIYGNDPAGQLSKLSSVIKITYDRGVTLNPNQKAELLAGQSPIGTPEEIAMKKAVEGAKLGEGIVEVDKRKYQVKLDAQGNKYLEIIPGQPAAAGENAFGTGDTAAQYSYMSDLVTRKPDPATWTPQERQNYAIMASVNFKADVKVTDAGKIVYVGGDVPPGLKPSGAVGAGAAAPAAAAPAAPAAAAPAAAAPAAAAPAAAAPKQNAAGHYIDSATGAPNYGGYLVEGQPGAKGTTRTVGGQTITELPSDQGPDKPANEQIGKSYNFTDQSLRSAQYMLNLDPSKLTPGVVERVVNDATDGTSFASAAQRYAMNENDREYFRHALELVKDFSHRDSGADVTKNDLITYKRLFDLPPDPTAKDIINLQTSIKDTLASARTTFNGTIPSDWLRGFDKKLHEFGIDLDEPVRKPAEYKEK